MAEIIKNGGGKFNKKTLLIIGGVFILLIGVVLYLTLDKNVVNNTPRKLNTVQSLDNSNKNYSGDTLAVDKEVKTQKENRVVENRKEAEKSGTNQIEAVPVDASYVKTDASIKVDDLLSQEFIPCVTSEYDAQGFHCRSGLNKQGYNIDGYDKNGFNKDGCNKEGKDITGKPCGNFLQPKDNACLDRLIARECSEDDMKYDKDGYDVNGYDKNGFDRQGFNKNGCDRQGYDKEGYHCQTKLNRGGFDRNGCDKDGYDVNGYHCQTKLNRDGFDKDGYDKDGFDKNGCNREGLNAEGKPCVNGKRGNVKLSQGERLWYENQLKNKDSFMRQLTKSQESKNMVVTFKKETDFVTYVAPEENAEGNSSNNSNSNNFENELADNETEDKNNADIEIPTGSMTYGTVLADINSDYPGMVRAKILGGPLDQAMIIGNYTVPFIEDPYRPRDKIKIIFNQLVYNRTTFTISAAGLDTQTMTDYIAGDVDHHYFTRWGGLIAANVLKGIGKAVATTGTSYSNDGSGTVYQQPITATTDQLKVAAGEVGNELSQIARQQFDRPPTVTSDRGSMIAIFFLKEVNDDRLPMLFNSREQLEMNRQLMMNPQINN